MTNTALAGHIVKALATGGVASRDYLLYSLGRRFERAQGYEQAAKCTDEQMDAVITELVGAGLLVEVRERCFGLA